MYVLVSMYVKKYIFIELFYALCSVYGRVSYVVT